MKKKIVIGSVLKPVNDARMYEKIATSLAGEDGLEIHVAGFKADTHEGSKVQFYPIFDFKRLEKERLGATWKFYKLLLQLKPEVVIITTHELLIVTILYKILFGCRILYDVQENYFRNLWFGTSFPPLIRQILAIYVRTKEIITRPFISHYLLAEKNYEKEFSFTKGKSTILENKAKRHPSFPARIRSNNQIRLLYSGTIAESYGIFEAISLAKALHEADPKITLNIIGYCPKTETLKKLRTEIQGATYITLEGGDKLVPHMRILEAIQVSDYGLLPYQFNQSTWNCIPTKLYEYLAYQLPMLVSPNPLWIEIVQNFNAGIEVDFHRFNPEKLLQRMHEEAFFNYPVPDQIFWESQEESLIQVIKSI